MQDHIWVQPIGEMLVCEICGYTRKLHASGVAPKMNCPRANEVLPLPGSELHAMLATLGISPTVECGCEDRMAQMDAWGVDGCREHFEEIIGWLRENSGKYSWTEKLKAGALAATSGLAFKISWADPFTDLVRIAIERAEAKSTRPAQ